MLFIPNRGDTVHVRKFVYDKWYEATDTVQAIRYDRQLDEYSIKVNDDWWRVENDILNTCEAIAPDDAHCRLCGSPSGPFTPVDIATNYDENGRQDDGGCFVRHHTEWQCADIQTCRKYRREMAQLLQEQARWADMEAREEGRGGRIGGGF